MGKTSADLFQERVNRVEDAIQLKEPDRAGAATINTVRESRNIVDNESTSA